MYCNHRILMLITVLTDQKPFDYGCRTPNSWWVVANQRNRQHGGIDRQPLCFDIFRIFLHIYAIPAYTLPYLEFDRKCIFSERIWLPNILNVSKQTQYICSSIYCPQSAVQNMWKCSRSGHRNRSSPTFADAPTTLKVIRLRSPWCYPLALLA